ncbi:MAG: HNH endonuclease signature motif containing protein [Pseudohongiellaceae bacterium]|nr:HNH endonuclease signature motif containing protein [Pseudohongiellaceae bacterium]
MPFKPSVHRPRTATTPKTLYKRSARATSAGRGYGYRWQKERSLYLQANPLCVRCEDEGRVCAATDLDHIIPHKGDMSLFWDKSNWQGLCRSHHSSKTAREDGGFGNRVISGRGGSDF